MKPLSEQLSELSVHAKEAEDAVAAAKREQFDKLMARKKRELSLMQRSERLTKI
jgi:hypothetical protein